MTTGQKIQTLRKQRGLTQEQLAQRLGVSRQAVSRWELDESLPETANLLPLGEVLGVSLDILLDPARGLEGPVPKEEPSAPAASAPTAPSRNSSNGGSGCFSCRWSWWFLPPWPCGGWAMPPPWH